MLPGLRYDTALGRDGRARADERVSVQRRDLEEIGEIVGVVRAGRTPRVREAGLDGIELAGANGMLFTQFL